MEEIQTPEGGTLIPIPIDAEVKQAYIDYSMSVITSRALPDVRDGLKPVHRRILYAMDELGLRSSGATRKCAKIVGDVLGKFHPHGDASVYDAIVHLGQDFYLRYPVITPQGNFGTIAGDPAAAYRYTEAKMAKLAEEMVADIDKDTVDFVPNFDETAKEPTVLPAKFPQLLVNGTAGIAVGMATNIPPHNMVEVINGTLMLIDNPDATIDELMGVIKGPDFPTAGLILGTEEIRKAYTTGRGVIKMRARAHIETMSNGKPRIIVTELPYQVNKARLIEKIAELVRDKQIDGVTDLRDESDRSGMRIVIELRRDSAPNVILNQLYKHTQLQDSFGVIMLALVDGQPVIMNLKHVLEHYIDHQEMVITRRTRYELAKAEARAHILEGLTIALDHLDAVITTIRESRTADIARTALMDGFKLTEKQAQAILDLRLQRLTGLEREKIEEEYQEVLKLIEELKGILADRMKVLAIIKNELIEVRDKYGDKRRTEITFDASEMDIKDLIAEEDVVVTLTLNNYIKRIPLDTYRRQRRGGVGVRGMGTKETDIVSDLLITTTHHDILFFTNRGRAFVLKSYEIPESGRQAKGTAIINLLAVENDERITAVIQVKEFRADRYLFLGTKHGVVKKTPLSEFGNIRKNGLRAVNLDEDDELIGVKFTDGENRIMLGTRGGKAITFPEEDVRSMGRGARGVRGINLSDGDEVVAMDILKQGSEVLTVTEGGYGKRTTAEEYRSQTRGGKGLINMKVTEKTGPVVGIRVVRENQELMLITTDGIVIRTTVDEISLISRNTQGVKLMTLGEADRVASMATMNRIVDAAGE